MSVVFRDGTSEGLLAYVDDRCSPGVQDGTWDSYADNLAFDALVPDPGSVAFNLVTGMAAGIESSLGTNSAGVPRANANPCP